MTHRPIGCARATSRCRPRQKLRPRHMARCTNTCPLLFLDISHKKTNTKEKLKLQARATHGGMHQHLFTFFQNIFIHVYLGRRIFISRLDTCMYIYLQKVCKNVPTIFLKSSPSLLTARLQGTLPLFQTQLQLQTHWRCYCKSEFVASTELPFKSLQEAWMAAMPVFRYLSKETERFMREERSLGAD